MNVYVCVTLYHVYVTLLEVFSTNTEKDKLVILLNANNKQIFRQFQYINKQLTKAGFKCDLRLHSKKKELIGFEEMKNRGQLSFVKKMMGLSATTKFTLYNFAWNNSYAYSTVKLLYKNCERAIFIEESAIIAKLPEEKKWKKYLQKIMGGVVDFYEDEKLQAICVQKPELFPQAWKPKLQKLELNLMLSKLSQDEKDTILQLMSEDSTKIIELLKGPSVGIVFTSPFSEDHLITEQEKINYTQQMCNYYKRYGEVIVKLHPRDTTNYHLESNIPVLSESFPSELLALTGYTFKFAIAICSSAVNTANAESKINMNNDFLSDKRFVLRDINGNVVQQ